MKREKQRGTSCTAILIGEQSDGLYLLHEKIEVLCPSLIAHLELTESFVLALAQSAEPRLGRFFVEEGLFPAALELLFQSLDPLVCPRISAIDIDLG